MLNGYQVANVIKANVRVSSRWMARRLQCSKSSSSKFLNAMAKKGWLRKQGKLFFLREEGLPKHLNTLKRFRNKQVDKILGYQRPKPKAKPAKDSSKIDQLIERKEKGLVKLKRIVETAERKLKLLKEIRKEL